MKVAFFSNFLSQHQLPLCEAMAARLGDGFTFVACEQIHQERVALGFEDMNAAYPFVLRAYENAAAYGCARALARECDVLIVGSAPQEFADLHLSSDRLTFRYSERLFKKGTWRRHGLITHRRLRDAFLKYRASNLYVLCASAYTASDLDLCGFPSERCLRWGYFPAVREHELDALLDSKPSGEVRILWAGRMVSWKHAEDAIRVAARLRSSGHHFTFDIIGAGPRESAARQLISRLGMTDCIHMIGAVPPDDVRIHMESANVFLFTSDRREGWGVVLNEAMNSGCAVVASHEIGSVPFLMHDGVNGLVYQSGNLDSLQRNIVSLLNDRAACRRIARCAASTVMRDWSAATAVDRLLEVIPHLQSGRGTPFSQGLCSQAPILTDDWFVDKEL
ncbi:MAG: glycosyltransferase family 4 protein [Coriobacteriia bacterium]